MLTVMAGLAATAASASAETASSATASSAPAIIIPPPPGYAPIVNENSQLCLGINSAGAAGQWSCTHDANQEWMAVPYGDGYYIKNKSGQCLYAASTADGTQVYAGKGGYCTQNTNDWVTWIDINDSISPRTDTSAVIGIAGGSTNQGANAVMWNPNGNIVANQEWVW